MDSHEMLAAWTLPEPRTLRPTAAGTNNLSHVVETPAGSYFLRIYRNTSDPGRIRYEHSLLHHLQHADLSFAVPSPLATRGGETFVTTRHEGNEVVGALFSLIPGRHPQRGNVAQTAACGEALAELDDALARMEIDTSLPTPGMFGELDKVHPLVADPLAVVGQIAVPDRQKSRLRALLAELLALTPDLYHRLPQQIIHADLFASNVLMRGDRVSGILDFEFASPDLRAMDVAVGVWAFGVSAWDPDDQWPLIRSFAEGYRRRLVLNGEEIAALPILLRLREAMSLVHWMGRLQQGLTTEQDIARRADNLLQLDEWLHTNGQKLARQVEHAMR